MSERKNQSPRVVQCPCCGSFVDTNTLAQYDNPARKAFTRRFIADRVLEMDKEQWGEWVNKLPQDEFWHMMLLRNDEDGSIEVE